MTIPHNYIPPRRQERESRLAQGATTPSQAVGTDFAPLETRGRHGRIQDDPFRTDTLEAQRAYDEAVTLEAKGDEPGAIEHYVRAAKIAEDAREWYLAAVCARRAGEFFEGTTPPHDLDRAFRLFRRAIASYDRCGLFDEARELSYSLEVARLWMAKELGISRLTQARMFALWLLSGFGYRPFRVILASLVIILGYGVVYWLTGGVVAARVPAHVGFLQSLYFSGITFATVGYGDFVPTRGAEFIALSEGFIGPFLIGFFIAVLVNKTTPV